MNQSFATQFTERLQELVADLRYFHKPTGKWIAPRVVETMFLARARGQKEDCEYPAIRWAIYKGAFDRHRPQPFSVILNLGLLLDTSCESVVEGTANIIEFTNAVGKLCEKPIFAPYKLKTPIPFQIGDPTEGQEGMQPHPYYWSSMHLDFLKS
ncbi:hypothetical protein [Desulfotalea psychrophila]|uniref:Uncharacterized protein n=1 Tax=Desulfotalea psychrophila (strain LSv54 / DSM 12343) TaxID=177439 RepID=Q6AMV7_DESPS|nr:hypothetical protein [Desulfotalea psychrophila]CAG36317.1 unknown protein [Desulfotalea psychrophila LSv54]